jgi:hypothetical protein
VQQKEVGLAPVAVPVGVPVPAVTVQLPAFASIGVEARVTGDGPVKATHALGALSEPPMQLVMAGEPMVHCAPVGAPHWHAEQVRGSLTPA